MLSRQIKIGAVLNYLNMALGFGFTLFVLPFIIRKLGQEEFGIFCLIGALSSYLNLFQFGMGNTIVRYVAKYNAENNQKGKENFLALISVLHVIIGCLILAAGTILIFQLDNIFAASLVNAADITKGRVMLAILTVGAAICSFTNVFVGVLSGSEEFVFPRIVSTLSWCGRVLTTIVILIQIPSAVWITLITVSFAVFSGVLNTLYAFWKVKIRVRLYSWEWLLFKEVMFFSMYNFLLQIVGLLYWKIGGVIAGIRMSATDVAVYSIGIQLNFFTLQLSNSMNNLLLPHATKITVRNASVKETTCFVASVGRIVLMIYGAILLGFAFFGKSFITLWAGEGYERAYYVTLIALSAAAIPRIQSGMNLVMQAKNMHGRMAIVYAISGTLSIPIAWLWSVRFGVVGIVGATGLGLLLGNVIIANIYFVKKVGLSLGLFIKNVLSGLWLVFLISFMACYAVIGIKGDGICTFIIQCTIYIVVYIACLLLWGLNMQERSELISIARKLPGLFGKKVEAHAKDVS